MTVQKENQRSAPCNLPLFCEKYKQRLIVAIILYIFINSTALNTIWYLTLLREL